MPNQQQIFEAISEENRELLKAIKNGGKINIAHITPSRFMISIEYLTYTTYIDLVAHTTIRSSVRKERKKI